MFSWGVSWARALATLAFRGLRTFADGVLRSVSEERNGHVIEKGGETARDRLFKRCEG